MEWSDFYKLPLKIDEGTGIVIAQPTQYTNHTWAWDWIDNEFISECPVGSGRGASFANAIISYINGTSEWRPNCLWSPDPSGEPTVICMNGIPCIDIRGFGDLIGCCKLSYEEAAKIQNDFRDWIIEKLNN